MNKKNILIALVIIATISASFILGRNTGETQASKAHQTELEKLQEKYQSQTPENTKDCRPEVDSKVNNYVVGYGSLMNKQSRQITVPNATFAAPVLVNGFERLWASRGYKSKATFLLAIPNKGYAMNAIYYESSAKEISATDLRESSYCRVKIPRKDLVPLGIKSLPKGDFWMYVKDFKDTKFPTRDFPILQTYADVFITGCLQTQAEFNLTEFGQLCFNTTYNWDLANWFYDRSNPRYARYSKNTEKYRTQIDKIIRRLNFEDDPL